MTNSINAIRFLSPFNYFDNAGAAHAWDVGQVVYDTAEIADLKARGAPTEPLQAGATMSGGEWAAAHLPGVYGLASALDAAAAGLRGADGRAGALSFFGKTEPVADDATLLAFLDVVEPKLTTTIADALRALRADIASRRAVS